MLFKQMNNPYKDYLISTIMNMKKIFVANQPSDLLLSFIQKSIFKNICQKNFKN